MPTRSYLSQSEKTLTFGFGEGKTPPKIEKVEIAWPSGETTALEELPFNKTETIEEG
jgi:ASPIC and UnbV